MSRLIASFAAAAGIAASTSAFAVEISISCSALGKEYEICKQGADAWAKKTGNTVKIVSTPNSATERLALYQQLLAAGAGDIDVFQIDVVWPGILGNHFDRPDRQGAERRSATIFPPWSRPARSTASWWRCRGSPMRACSITARTCSRSTSAPCRRPGPSSPRPRATIQDGERKAGSDDFWGYRLAGPGL